MIETLSQLDRELFFFFNRHNSPFWDEIMYFLSEKEVWFPFYAALILGVIWQFKKYSWIIILCAVMAIGASDFVTSGIMKPTFERYRPSRDETIMEKVHIVKNYRGGRYGFASSHAANTFAMATFFFLLWRSRWKLSIWLFIWAALVSYSRIYLGVHYPGDILIGAVIGTFFGWLFFMAARKVFEKKIPAAYQHYF
ncbi:MAG: phosphatase PAP2 family protein [Candidatus Cyclobacteriaceae bacterium M2_1C_046]